MKTEQICFKTTTIIRKKLEKYAKKYGRSLSNYIEFILSGAIEYEERVKDK